MTDHLVRVSRRGLLAFALAAWAVSLGCPLARTQERVGSPTEAAVNQLQQDVDLLGEINRLDLTKDRLRALIVEVEALQARTQENQARRDQVLARLKPHLEAQKAALLKDEQVPQAVNDQIKTLADELQKLDAEADTALAAEFAPRIRKVLDPQQVDILTWLSEARLQAQGLVDWARGMTDEDFKTDAAANAENLAEGRDDITAEKILDVFRRARAGSEADYAKSRDKLAEELIPATRSETDSVDSVLVHRLQPPRLLSVLGEKLAQMR
jgi:hypothetical protein